ncbi:MAG TPA: nuclease A inhibitor family protein [Trichocoleus sp.]
MGDRDRFVQALEDAIAPLYYPSETDASLGVTVWETPVLNLEALRQVLNLPAETSIEERSANAFFDRVTCDLPEGGYCAWHGADAEALANQYRTLRDLMQSHLEHLTFYRVGQIEVAAYVVGRYDEATWIGIATELIET